jgi:predicted sulfurtransferase
LPLLLLLLHQMYCTGGIRCDVYSALLRQKGFKNLYTLHGGIQHYLKEEGNEHWKGSLFVFDGRMAINPALEGKLKEGEVHHGHISTICLCNSCTTLPSYFNSIMRNKIRSHLQSVHHPGCACHRSQSSLHVTSPCVCARSAFCPFACTLCRRGPT